MEIFTSYFAKVRYLPDGYVPVSIAAHPPRGYYGACLPDLAPPWDLVKAYKANNDSEAYTEQYNKLVLSTLSVGDILGKIRSVAGPGIPVLLCYERPSDFCHRHLVATWFRENGVQCGEFVM